MDSILNSLNNSLGTEQAAWRMAGREMGPRLGDSWTPTGPVGPVGTSGVLENRRTRNTMRDFG